MLPFILPGSTSLYPVNQLSGTSNILTRSGATPAYDPDAAILALNLWGGGARGAWWDPADAGTLFQDTSATTPSGNSDPVQRQNDKSGNGNHRFAPTLNARSILQKGAQAWLKADGLDDGFNAPITLSAAMSIYMAVDRVSDPAFVLAYDQSGAASRFLGCAQSSVSNSWNGIGSTPTRRVNGVAVGPSRQNLLDAMPANTPVVLTFENCALNLWTNFTTSMFSSLEFGGRDAGIIICPDQNATNRGIIEQAMAYKAGITL